MSKFKFINRGSQETFVLLPGWATDHRIFETLDLGSNYLLPDDISTAGLEAGLFAAMEENRLARISILGWSMGAFQACGLLPRFRECVDTLVLVGARKRYEATDIERIRTLLGRNRKAFLRTFYGDCFSEDEKGPAGWFKSRLLKEYMDCMKLGRLLEGLDYLSRSSIDPSVLKGTKVKFIHGRADKIAPIEEALALKDSLPEVDFMIVDKTGHMPFLNPNFKRIFDGGK